MLKAIVVALACAGAACAQDAEDDPPRLGDISLDTERGVYLRASGLLNGYADADFQTSSIDEELEFDPAAGATFAVGYHQSSGNKGFRIEGELSYDKTDADLPGFGEIGEIEFASFAVNGYFDYRFDERWSWYIGGGLGGSAVDASGDAGDAEDDGAGFIQVMTGAEFRITGPFTVYGGLRLRAYETIELEDDSEVAELDGFASLGLEIGVMFRF